MTNLAQKEPYCGYQREGSFEEGWAFIGINGHKRDNEDRGEKGQE
jgi:hypothetical protein